MDFLINVLKDHEKSLDTLITRAEDVIEDKPSLQMIAQNPPPLKITLRDWGEYKDLVAEAELICFEMKDSMFLCNAITKNKIYNYSEEAPYVEVELSKNNDLVMKGLNLVDLDDGISSFNGKLDIGLPLKSTKVKQLNTKNQRVLYELDLPYTKDWLSREIGIHRNYIVHGIVD
jgi:hypothetical protein